MDDEVCRDLFPTVQVTYTYVSKCKRTDRRGFIHPSEYRDDKGNIRQRILDATV